MSSPSTTARLLAVALGTFVLVLTCALFFAFSAKPSQPRETELSAIESIRLSQSLQTILEDPTAPVPQTVELTLTAQRSGAPAPVAIPVTYGSGSLATLDDALDDTPAQTEHAVQSLGTDGSIGPALTATASIATPKPRPRIETFRTVLERGGTLMNLLTGSGASRREAYEAIEAMTPLYNPRRLREGQPVHLVMLRTPTVADAATGQGATTGQDGEANPWSTTTQLMGMRLRTDVDREVVITRAADGSYGARELKHELEQRMARVRGTIRSSLFASAQDLGVPAAVIVEFVGILAYSVDFSREIQPGDEFEILYSVYLNDEGAVLKSGQIAFAAMTTSGRERNLYRYVPGDDDIPDYFSPDGQSVKQFLMRTPVDAVRISSRFGRRKHPIQNRWRTHKGVDFAAPTGTRIYAAGNGTVSFVGRQRGYGKIIKIRHANGYETRYAHMNGFASGMRRGKKVSQGQVIGYVGATGWATGPHLHYEVRLKDQAMDPLSIKVPTGRKLEGTTLAAFQKEIQQVNDLREKLPVISNTRTAEAQAQ